MKKTYLIFYNSFLFLAWTAFFIYWLSHGMEMDTTALILLNVAQLGAILEILHAALKWVKSPVATTAMQVFSRVFVLYWINVMPKEAQMALFGITGVQVVAVAWSITEMVRYSFYATQLLKLDMKALLFLRYTLFIVLYPLGVLGEFLILISQIYRGGIEFSILEFILAGILVSYFIFFPKLYLYMFRQRKKKL